MVILFTKSLLTALCDGTASPEDNDRAAWILAGSVAFTFVAAALALVLGNWMRPK